MLQKFLTMKLIYAIHHPVVLMQFATMGNARVYRNTKEIHTMNAALNAFLVQTVLKIKHASGINVQIRVTVGCVQLTQYVK